MRRIVDASSVPRWSFHLLAAALAAGCGEATPERAERLGRPPGCAAGQVSGPEGDCMPVGIQGCAGVFLGADGLCHPAMERCPQGTIPEFATGCAPVGISGCAAAFLGDDGLCHPTIDRCPSGTLATPQDGCVPIDGPDGCGTGAWGDIPEDSGTIYVDPSYPGADGDGTRAKPLKTIADAMTRVGAGGRIALAKGVYDEPVAITRSIELAGRCPSMVRLQGVTTAYNLPAVVLVDNVPSVAIRGVEIGGAGIGVLAVDAPDLSIRQVHVRAATMSGLAALRSMTKVSVLRSVIEGTTVSQNVNAGVTALAGAQVTLDKSVITDNGQAGIIAEQPGTEVDVIGSLVAQTAAGTGQGIGVLGAAGAHVTVTDSAVIEHPIVGVDVIDPASSLTVTRSLIEDPASARGDRGCGVGVDGARASVEESVLEGNGYAGLCATGGVAALTGCLVKDTRSRSDDPVSGGVVVMGGTQATLRSNAIVHNEGAGIILLSGSPHLEATGNLIEDTVPTSSARAGGDAVELNAGEGTLSSSALVGSAGLGVVVAARGTSLTATGNVVESAPHEESDGTLRGGLLVIDGGRASLAENLVINNRGTAVAVGVTPDGRPPSIPSTFTSTGDLIQRTLPVAIPGLLGQLGTGIYAQGSVVSITSSVIRDSAMTGMQLNFGSTADAHRTLIDTVHGGFVLGGDGKRYDAGDGILVMAESTVALDSTRILDCQRAGILSDSSAGRISRSTSSNNRFGVVIDGTPKPQIDRDNTFAHNRDVDRLFDGDLPVPSVAPPVR